MKKIKSIHQLKAEKLRIKKRRAELEDSIRENWTGLKATLKPSSLAKEAYNDILDHQAEANLKGDGVLRSTLNYGISLLAKKITTKAGDKLGKLFKK